MRAPSGLNKLPRRRARLDSFAAEREMIGAAVVRVCLKERQANHREPNSSCMARYQISFVLYPVR